jgi:acetolactate synthase small subunit
VAHSDGLLDQIEGELKRLVNVLRVEELLAELIVQKEAAQQDVDPPKKTKPESTI